LVTGITVLAGQAEAAAREEKRLRLKQAEDGEDGEGFKTAHGDALLVELHEMT